MLRHDNEDVQDAEIIEDTTDLESVGSDDDIAQKRFLRTLRSNFADLLTGSITKVINNYKTEYSPEFIDSLTNVIQKNDKETSFLAEVVVEATSAFDFMMANWGSNLNPGYGHYLKPISQMPFQFRLHPLKTNSEGWPILDAFYPGYFVIRTHYSVKNHAVITDSDEPKEAVYGFKTSIINGAGEIVPAVWLIEDIQKMISSAVVNYGLTDEESYKQNKDQYFLVVRDECTLPQAAMIADISTTTSAALSTLFPLVDFNKLIHASIDDISENIDDIYVDTSEDFVNTNIQDRDTLAVAVVDGKVKCLYNYINEHFTQELVVQEVLSDFYTDLIREKNPSLLNTDNVVIISRKS